MKRYISFLLAVLMLVTLVPTAAFADAAETDMKASDNLKLLIKGWEGLTAYGIQGASERGILDDRLRSLRLGHLRGHGDHARAGRAYFEQDIVGFERGVNNTAKNTD